MGGSLLSPPFSPRLCSLRVFTLLYIYGVYISAPEGTATEREKAFIVATARVSTRLDEQTGDDTGSQRGRRGEPAC